MNNQLIEKVIKSGNGNDCPEFTYENPLLDRKVASALARSFVKILHVSQADSNINNNLRHSALANIRKICRLEPENHMAVDENITESLTEVYMDKIRDSQTNASVNSIDRTLEEFLIRRMKEIDFSSNYEPSMNPEVVQALLNMCENSSKMVLIINDIIHWNVSNKKYLALVKDLWANSNLADSSSTSNVYDDISIKMKSEIEIILLNFCHSLLTDPNVLVEELFAINHTLIDIVEKSSQSAECFQMCSRILNYLFIQTNYNLDIQHFISKFIQNVNLNCTNGIAVLYPAVLSPTVVLLDIDLNVLPPELKSKYVEQTIVNLNKCTESSDVVMLLSHYPLWFPIYKKI